MANQKFLPEWINARTSGQSISAELHVVGEDGVANEYFLKELPEPGTTVTIASRTQQASGDTLAANEFTVDYKTGKVTTHSSNNGQDVSVAYTAIGSTPLQRDMERIFQAIGPWNINIHKPVVDTPDDEFDAATKDAKWTATDGTVGTVDEIGTIGGNWEMFPELSAVAFQPDSNGAIEWRQTYTLPDNKCFILCVTPSFSIDGTPGIVNNELHVGMWMTDNDTSPETTNFIRLLIDTGTDNLRVFFGQVAGTTNTPDGSGYTGRRYYLKIRRSGTTYYAYFSTDPQGLGWTAMGSIAVGATLTRVWIAARASASIPSIKPISMFHFFREGDPGVTPW
jgi:hypothetical protein